MIIQGHSFLFLNKSICCDPLFELPGGKGSSDDASQRKFLCRLNRNYLLSPSTLLIQSSVIGIQRELQSLRSIEHQRLEMLRAKHRHTYDAVMWLRQNKDRFSGTIHEPIMLCVSKFC